MAQTATAALKRAPSMPDVPTTAEAGYPAASYLFWSGLFAPANTSPDICRKLNLEGEGANALLRFALQNKSIL